MRRICSGFVEVPLGTTPLYTAARPPSFHVELAQWITFLYFPESSPCILDFTTSMGWNSSTLDIPAKAPVAAEERGVDRISTGI
jgi:hypothetical protein